MAWARMAASGTGSLVYIDDVTADRNSMMNSHVYWAVLAAQIQPKAVKLDSALPVQMDNDPKILRKQTKNFLRHGN